MGAKVLGCCGVALVLRSNDESRSKNNQIQDGKRKKKLDKILYVEVLSINSNNIITSIIKRIGKYKYYNKWI